MSMNNKIKFILIVLSLIIFTIFNIGELKANENITNLFSENTIIDDSLEANLSKSQNLWLKSGGRFVLNNGIGKTIIGNLNPDDQLRKTYAGKNPTESDNGYHPQNLLQLLTRQKFNNPDIQTRFKIVNNNAFNIVNNQPWNGISLLSNYQDDNNFYIATLRVDGKIVIKKKTGGIYQTLIQKTYFAGNYDNVINHNLLPQNREIGLRFITKKIDNNIYLSFYIEENGIWKLVTEITDSNPGSLINNNLVGVWSNFMDIEFNKFAIITTDGTSNSNITPQPIEPQPIEPPAEENSTPISNNDTYGLSTNTTVTEAGSMSNSKDNNWWVNSGAYFYTNDKIGRTIKGELPINDYWRKVYASSNPVDTDNGYHPQNIFRLLTKNKFLNSTQEAYFKIDKYNTSSSPNREGHNGFLFLNRYVDSNNLYYTGLRVDGSVIIKKKLAGRYYTLAQTKVLPGTYNRTSNPNLIPTNTWIGLRSTIKNNTDGSVTINIYLDKDNNNNWILATQVTDSGKQGAVIKSYAYAGIRTDFMDVQFTNYKIKEN